MSAQLTEADTLRAESGAREHETLAEALLAAQRDMPAVEPDSTNPHFKSRFVSLGHLLAKVRPVLNRHGLVLAQAPEVNEAGQFVLRTKIMHASGETLDFPAPLTPTKNDPQGQGSAITYMRRYSLAAVLAIADQEDDDGNAGSDPATANGNQGAKPSEGQKKFLDDLIGQNYKDTDASLLRGYVDTLGKPAVSKAITGLKEGDENLKASLLNAAREWDTRNSDIPGDPPATDDNLDDVPFS